jgi:hypothetical protein
MFAVAAEPPPPWLRPTGMVTGQRRELRRRLSTGTALVLVVVGTSFATAAGAQADTAQLTVSPASGPPGTEVVATGTGFCPAPCTAVTIQFSGVEVLTEVHVGAAGTFQATFRVPGGTLAGANTVVAEQHDAAQAPQLRQATARFDITPSTPASGTPLGPSPSASKHKSSRPPTTATPDRSSDSSTPTDHQSPAPPTGNPSTSSPSTPQPSTATSGSPGSSDAATVASQDQSSGSSSAGHADRWWLVLAIAATLALIVMAVLLRRSRRSHPQP